MPLFLSKNNLVQHFLGKVRNQESNSWVFGSNLKKITLALILEANNEFSVRDTKVATPISDCVVKELSEQIMIVPVLRSGLVMSDALQSFFEDCVVMHLGIYRDESLNAVKYYEKFPENMENSKVILCDPLIATAATISRAMDILEKYKFQNITILGIIISEKAVEIITKKYPKVNIYVAAIDSKLNDAGYIIPGVGDAGNRLFRTK